MMSRVQDAVPLFWEDHSGNNKGLQLRSIWTLSAPQHCECTTGVGPLPRFWKTLPFAHQGISLRAFSFGRVPMSIRDVKEKPGKGVCCSGGAVRAARDPPEALVKLPV